MKHFYGHLLLAMARLFGATDDEIAPRRDRMHAQDGRWRWCR